MADGAQLGNPDDTKPDGVQGQAPTGDELYAELDEATREWLKTRHDNDPLKVAKQAYELDKFAGRAVAVPGADATAEDWEKFYAKLGRPENTDGYALTPPKDAPEGMPYNDELASAFKEKAFENGLTKAQAEKLHDWFVGTMADTVTGVQNQFTQDTAAQVEAANAALKEAWGDPGSETFQANLELSGRFFDAVDENGGLLKVLSDKGLLGPDREVLIPELAFAFAKAGAAIFTEGGTLVGHGDGLTDANPFIEENLTEIMLLVKKDPNKARVLAKAANRNPKDYGL